MFCILHITDLHRIESEPLSNAELLSALLADRGAYLREDPPIAAPQAIVVSGDIIQGVRIGEPDFLAKIRTQYQTAHELLVDLTNRFLEGDRSRVIIIPGNHDVDWNTAQLAMAPVASGDTPRELQRALFERGSLYRWDWKSRQLFKISDENIYRQRLGAFWEFFDNFYKGVGGLLRVAPWADANLYSLDGGKIGVAAFNSCVGNDCFAYHGEIPPEVVAQAHLDLMDLGNWRLQIAVWHHDIEGPPYRSDYMDPEIVRGMIGKGFRLGLYGHQHRTQITPQHAYLPNLETMAITSAGSLCAGSRELPTGARRGYSIIEINDDYSGARVHVREMAYANSFSRANLPIFGGRSYVDLRWTKPVDAAGRTEDVQRAATSATIERAEKALFEEKDPGKAITILTSGEGVANEELGRKLLVEAARTASDYGVLLDVVAVPKSIDEMVLGVDGYLALKNDDLADAYLTLNASKLEAPLPLVSDLKSRIALARKVRS